MIQLDDLVQVEVTAAMQRRAITYALRSIHYTYNRMGYADIGRRLPRIVAGIIAEEAVEAYFDRMQFAYEKSGRTHWRKIDVAEFLIGGKRADLKSYHVYPTPKRPIPQWLLEVEGLVPVDQLQRQSQDHVSIQAFLISPQVNRSATHSYAQALSKEWADGIEELQLVKIGGLAESGVSRIHLLGEDDEGDAQWSISASDSTEIKPRSIQAMLAPAIPESSITLDAGSAVCELKPTGWHDLWMDNPDVWLAGWATRDEYLAGEQVPRGAKTAVYTQGTRTENRCLMVPALQPMSLLR